MYPVGAEMKDMTVEGRITRLEKDVEGLKDRREAEIRYLPDWLSRTKKATLIAAQVCKVGAIIFEGFDLYAETNKENPSINPPLSHYDANLGAFCCNVVCAGLLIIPYGIERTVQWKTYGFEWTHKKNPFDGLGLTAQYSFGYAGLKSVVDFSFGTVSKANSLGGIIANGVSLVTGSIEIVGKWKILDKFP